MPYNFVADSFHKKKLYSRFLQVKCDFTPKTAVLRFWAPVWGAYEERTMIILGSLKSA